METKENKKSKLSINDSYDLQLVNNTNPVLRWVLMLPIGFLAILIVQLAYGFIFNKLLSEFAIIVNSIFIAMKYCVFVVAMVATAPVARKNKLQASMACAFIALLVAFGSTYYLYSNAVSVDWPMLISTSVACLLGISWAVWNVHVVTRKPLPATQEAETPMR